MGMARYYMKVKFRNQKAAEAALPKIAEFVEEGKKAETYWQSHRGQAHKDTFWAGFTEQFPTVTEMISDLVGGDHNNALAGAIDFGDEDDVPRMGDGCVLYTAYVWHFADWDRLGNFMVEKFNAEGAPWLSDEYMEPFDLL